LPCSRETVSLLYRNTDALLITVKWSSLPFLDHLAAAAKWSRSYFHHFELIIDLVIHQIGMVAAVAQCASVLRVGVVGCFSLEWVSLLGVFLLVPHQIILLKPAK
jgi:hypothetical protein